MTKQRSFKQRIRARMNKTGERYTAARRHLITKAIHQAETAPIPVQAALPPPASEPAPPSTAVQAARISDASVRARTGRGRDEWYALLDEWYAPGRSHTEIARWLHDAHGVEGWWAQSITVAYEQDRGLREPGQMNDGFTVSASKTLDVPVERLFAAFVDQRIREHWLPGTTLHLRSSRPGKSLTAEWGDGSTRLSVIFITKGDAKSQVALQHTRLPDAAARDSLKAFWRERFELLKQTLTS